MNSDGTAIIRGRADGDTTQEITIPATITYKNEQYKSAIDVINKVENDISFLYLKVNAYLNVKKYNEAIGILYGLPQDKKDNEEFDYLLLWAYILRAKETKTQNDINEMNDFSYYLSQKYGKNEEFVLKLKELENKYKA